MPLLKICSDYFNRNENFASRTSNPLCKGVAGYQGLLVQYRTRLVRGIAQLGKTTLESPPSNSRYLKE
jgi:hypothetical protein